MSQPSSLFYRLIFRLWNLLLPGGLKPTLRWLVVGLGFLGINSALLYVLVEVVGLSVPWSTLIAVEFATLVRYLIHDLWVFEEERLSWHRLLRYHVANAAGFIVWWTAANGLTWLGVHYLLASLLAVGASTGFSFASNFYWIWHQRIVAHHTAAASKSTVCGVIVLRADGAALLQHRDDVPTINDPGLWVIPGGHVEPGETPLEGAVREVEEETCYRSTNPRLLVDFHGNELGYPGDFRMIFFWDEYDGIQHIKCREGQAASFVRREDAHRLPSRDYLVRVWDLALAARRTCQ